MSEITDEHRRYLCDIDVFGCLNCGTLYSIIVGDESKELYQVHVSECPICGADWSKRMNGDRVFTFFVEIDYCDIPDKPIYTLFVSGAD